MSTLKKVFWGALLVKLVLAAFLPLTNDEAYYWVWSQHLQLSYYDHPPFVAWLYYAGDAFRFFPGSVRWPGVLLAHASLGIWLLLLKPYLDERQRLYWLLLAVLSPLVGGSAIVVTPDVPLMFFYALSLWMFFMWRSKPEWKLSLAFGVSMGLGFSSKYMMVLFVISLLPLVTMDRRLRINFVRSLPWLLLGAIAGTLPVWLWNYMHDFASLKFQAAHGLGRKFWKPSWTYEYIGLQIALVFPVILYWALRAGRQMPRVFHFLAWVPLLFFLFTTSRGYVEANWPIAAYPAIFALAVSSLPLNTRSLRFTLAVWATLLTLLAGVVLLQPTWAKPLKFREFSQFDPIIVKAREVTPLYARSYQMASKLSFEMGRPIYKLRGMNRKDFYDFLEQSMPQEALYYIAAQKDDRLPKEFIERGDQVTEKVPIDGDFELWKVERKP
ncbi:MAG: glycosyltransferase family 39 protein [Bdellovibrionales bacterium]|nr:glycosyltransferase family 39 protein [Bdellovibrionales bacterium]